MASEEAPEVQTEEPIDEAAFEGYVYMRTQGKRPQYRQEFLAQPAHERKVYKQLGKNKGTKKEKQKKRERYPGEPTRPPNSWQLFCNAHKHLLAQKKKEDADNGVKGKPNTLNFFQPLYEKISEKDKKKYHDDAARLMKEYNTNMDTFFATHKEYFDDRKKGKRGARAKPKADGKVAAPAAKAEAKKRVKGETSAAKIIKREAPKKAAVPEEDEESDGLGYD